MNTNSYSVVVLGILESDDAISVHSEFIISFFLMILVHVSDLQMPCGLELIRSLGLSLHETNKIGKSETMKSKVMWQVVNVKSYEKYSDISLI